MGLKGRKRRLKNFGQRASAFAGNIDSAGVSTVVMRERKHLEVGANEHRRLVLKNHSRHATRAKIDEGLFVAFLEKNGIVPKNYSLVTVAVNPEFGVQEYFHRPSLQSLIDFMELRQGNFFRGKEDRLLCKQFLNQHREITLEKLHGAWNELSTHLRLAKIYFQIESNVIVVGKNRDGKLRLAIVDV